MVVQARLFTGVLLSALLSSGLILVPFATGWEVGTAIVGVKELDYTNTIFTSNCKGYDSETEAIISGQSLGYLAECSTGASTWTIDVDFRNFGRPSLLMTTQQPRHTDAGGEPTTHDQPADTRIVTRQRDTFYLDRHIFMFEFQVHTVADVIQKNCYFIEGCSFDHETSAIVPNFSTDILRGTVEYSHNGQPFDGSSLILFGINPWQGIRQPPDGTIRFDQWAGIMQATVFWVENGKIPDAPGSQDFPWAVEKLIAEGGQPNMFTLQGDTQSLTSFGTVGVDARIPQRVLIELPYKLTAGAAMKRNAFGNYNGLAPINVFAKYMVRVDVLVTTGWTPQLDYIDANNNGVLDTGEFTFIDKNNDNKWTLSIDEAVSGIPPSPPPAPAIDPATTTTTMDDPVSKEQPAPAPSGLQTGCPPNCPVTIQPPTDIFFPSCNFFDLECRLANWSKFPFDLGTTFALALPIIAIIAVVFIGLIVLKAAGGKRGR